jgi:DNA-binding MarR family transcriptional regulator
MLIPTKPIPESILRSAARIKTIADHYVFNPLGMTTSTFRILNLLYRSEDGRQTPGELLKFSGGTKSNMSQRLNFLQKHGLVKRVNPKKGEDNRKVFVTLTASGKTLVKNVDKRISRAKIKLEDNFTQKEIEGYFSFIDKLNQFLDDNEKSLRSMFD